MANPFVWHELMTTDPDAAADFYTRVTGWTTEPWDQDASYRMFVGPAGPLAGYMAMPDQVRAMGAPPNWLTYIATPDVDATTRQAAQLGATILREPDDIPNVGRFSVIRDPGGAVFAAFTPGQAAPPTPPDAPDPFSWHELATPDVDAALEFYGALFGFRKTDAMDMGPGMGVYQMFGAGGASLGGIYRKPESMPAPPHWMPYALVEDSKRAAGVLTNLGGTILNGPMEVPGGDWIVMAMDPQGAAFAVHSRKPTATAKPAASRAKAGGAKAAGKASPRKKAAAKNAPPRKAAPKKQAAARRAAPKKAAPKKAAKKLARGRTGGAKRAAARGSSKKSAARARGRATRAKTKPRGGARRKK